MNGIRVMGCRMVLCVALSVRATVSVAGRGDIAIEPLPRKLTSDDIYIAPMDCLQTANAYSKGHGSKAVAQEWKDETFQSLDLDGDGVCDIVSRDDNGELHILGLGVGFSLQRPAAYAKTHPNALVTKLTKTTILVGAESEETEQAYIALVEENFGYVDEGDWFFPGVGGDDSSVIAMAFYSKLGGPPYIMTRGRVRNSSAVSTLSRLHNPNAIGDTSLPTWNVYRWDPKHEKFRGGTLEEYHAVRKFAADRWREYALEMLREHVYHKASLNIGYAGDAYTRDWRNYYWAGIIEYAGAQFKKAAKRFETALDRQPPDPTHTLFNLGLSYEAQCWRQLAESAPGVRAVCDAEAVTNARGAYERYLAAAPRGERVGEVKARLADLKQGIYRTPSVDAEMAPMAEYTTQFANAIATAMDGVHAGPMPPPDHSAAGDRQFDPAYTGQPASARVRDVYQLKPDDLRKIDADLTQRLRTRNVSFTQERVDWMIAYKAKFPDADLDDMIARPDKYEALGWVKDWRQAYRGVQKR